MNAYDPPRPGYCPYAAAGLQCPNDTDGDGDCPKCATRPDLILDQPRPKRTDVEPPGLNLSVERPRRRMGL